MPAPTRDSWNSRLGFLLATVGSAVGLGNLWRFAYTASEGGGAAFVLLYLVLVFVIGVPVITAELAIGRHTGLSPVRALTQIGGRNWGWLGPIFVMAGFGILSFYSVVMGWTGRMLIDTIRSAIPADTAAYFGSIETGWVAVVFALLSLGITVAIVVRGIRGGIERASAVLMPLLFLLLIGLAIWAATLSGGGPGYRFYLRPDPQQLLNPELIASATGQAFFSLSLGMGAIITYASYLKDEGSLPSLGASIALSDTAVAVLGGLVTFPIIYHFGLQGDVSSSNVGALFIAVPKAFASIGAAGVVVGITFFVALYIAALTSTISLLEVVVSACIDAWAWSRQRATLIAGAAIGLASIPCAFSPSWLGFVNQVMGELVLVFGGMMIAVLTGWIWHEGADRELAKGFSHPGLRRVWLWTLRTIVPIGLAVVLYVTIRATMPAASALFGGG